jgi:uncharacterized protein
MLGRIIKFLKGIFRFTLTPMRPVNIVIVGLLLFFLIVPLAGFLSSIWPPRILSDVTPADFGIEYERVSFETEDGVLIQGWFIPSESDTDKAIVALHGYPADKGNILPIVLFLREDYNLFLFDFRYLGESGGRFSTAGIREVKDLRSAIEFLKDREVRDIGLWRFSVGGAVALSEAWRHPEIKAVFSDSSYARLDILAPELYRIPFVDRPLGAMTIFWSRILLRENLKEKSPEYGSQNLKVPVFITHSKNDDVIPFSHALIIQETLSNNEKAEFWFREDDLHGMISEEYKQKVKEFFTTNL